MLHVVNFNTTRIKYLSSTSFVSLSMVYQTSKAICLINLNQFGLLAVVILHAHNTSATNVRGCSSFSVRVQNLGCPHQPQFTRLTGSRHESGTALCY
mmetsp:Transcript_12472/g.35434  ORF Transcript_12472/g.35434 Transcript_12472/m.35434 type:complete len:97 (-) Transcript_12472:2264-2554(-)